LLIVDLFSIATEAGKSESGKQERSSNFHEAVLKNGAVPLEILEEQVNECMGRKKA
jgi:uncharacterized protein (DUF885 family)